jgi:pimeloyl-ACP methyl ester carboxylesterase
MNATSIRLAALTLAAACACGLAAPRAADMPVTASLTEPHRPAAPTAERPPIVIIPGAPGSELVDGKTGARVWPSAKLMSKRDGNAVLALPLHDPESSPIVASGLLRVVHVGGMKFHIHAYDGLEKRLHELGYREGDWKAPAGEGQYFYFAYDWRQSVETNGRRLSRELDALYARIPSGTPPAIVLGHSLGGLIARYALMYGDTPLGSSGPLPPVTWGEREHIGKLFLVATPNEGTFLALQRLEKGIYYRWHRGAFSPETLFTYPSVFDMIPAQIPPLVDGDGKPQPFDLADPDDWERLSWSIVNPTADSTIPYPERREHLASELRRIARLHAALTQLASTPNPATLYVVGCLSRSVQRTALLTSGSHGFKVRFDPPAYSRSRLKPLLFEPGDAMVPARSLIAQSSSHDPAGSLRFARVVESRESHQDTLSSPETLEALRDVLK